jgi:serine/threonine protein kinase
VTSLPSGPRSDGLVGRVVVGRFELQVLAAAGGMGQVYQARDRLSGEMVAVKVVPNEGASPPGDPPERQGLVGRAPEFDGLLERGLFPAGS